MRHELTEGLRHLGHCGFHRRGPFDLALGEGGHGHLRREPALALDFAHLPASLRRSRDLHGAHVVNKVLDLPELGSAEVGDDSEERRSCPRKARLLKGVLRSAPLGCDPQQMVRAAMRPEPASTIAGLQSLFFLLSGIIMTPIEMASLKCFCRGTAVVGRLGGRRRFSLAHLRRVAQHPLQVGEHRRVVDTWRATCGMGHGSGSNGPS